MKAKFALSFAVCSFGLVGSGVAPMAFPGLAVIAHFTPVGQGVTENPCVTGLGLLKFSNSQGTTNVSLLALGLQPDTTYGVKLDSDSGGFTNPIAFTTDCLGFGVFMMAVPQDRTSHPNMTIFRWDGDIDTIDTIGPDETRAFGN